MPSSNSATARGACLLRRRHPRGRRGSAILELAIVLPILSMLIVGIIDWGFILFIDQQMIQAAREGVRIRAAEGENYDDSRAQQATEEYLAAVYPSLAGDFTVTASGNSGGKAWVQVVIPLADASLTSGLLVLPGGDLSIRIEMDYLGATP